MKTITLQYKKGIITSIDRLGLTYLDHDVTEHFIDFLACRYEWYNINLEFYAGLNEIDLEEIRFIGFRDSTATPAYIELYSNPRVRFIFPEKRGCLFSKRLRPFNYDFIDVQQAINRAGWSAFDLS